MAIQLEAMAQATSVEALFAGLEDRGRIKRFAAAASNLVRLLASSTQLDGVTTAPRAARRES